MKDKTQVFLAAQGDHYRTRLTHTLEVSQIARTIARALNLNEDLTEAIALGHDLGHTPFGHSGEDALNMVHSGGFRHAEQSVRVVEVLEKEGKGYVVASLGVDSGYVPYTSYSAKTSFLNENPQIIQSFTNALQKGMDYVQSHSPEEIAQVISPQFPETDMDTLTTIVKRYYEQDTWKENLIFEKDSFELLQDILESAGELSDRADCENLVTTAFAEAAIS